MVLFLEMDVYPLPARLVFLKVRKIKKIKLTKYSRQMKPSHASVKELRFAKNKQQKFVIPTIENSNCRLEFTCIHSLRKDIALALWENPPLPFD